MTSHSNLTHSDLTQLTSHNWPHTTDLTQLTSHNWPHTTDLTQLTSHNWPHTTDLTQLTSHTGCRWRSSRNYRWGPQRPVERSTCSRMQCGHSRVNYSSCRSCSCPRSKNTGQLFDLSSSSSSSQLWRAWCCFVSSTVVMGPLCLPCLGVHSVLSRCDTAPKFYNSLSKYLQLTQWWTDHEKKKIKSTQFTFLNYTNDALLHFNLYLYSMIVFRMDTWGSWLDRTEVTNVWPWHNDLALYATLTWWPWLLAGRSWRVGMLRGAVRCRLP